VVPRGGKLQIYNPIYAAVYTADWVRNQLAELRPPIYGEAIRAWEAAPPEQRASYLISGAPLEKALEWARGKRLSDIDQEFLEASRLAAEGARQAEEAARLAEERARVAELETRRAQEQAARAEKDKQRAEQDASNRRKVVTGLSAGLVALTGVSAFAMVQQQAADRNAEVAETQKNKRRQLQIWQTNRKNGLIKKQRQPRRPEPAPKQRKRKPSPPSASPKQRKRTKHSSAKRPGAGQGCPTAGHPCPTANWHRRKTDPRSASAATACPTAEADRGAAGASGLGAQRKGKHPCGSSDSGHPSRRPNTENRGQ
jgi:hypothetical protein